MGLLSRQLAADTAGLPHRDPLSGFWYGMAGRKVTSGVIVNHATAMNYSACWAALGLLTETMATLPRVMYRQTGKNKSHATGHPTYRAFRSEPNPWQGGVNHFGQQMGFTIQWGNAYAEKIKDFAGRVTQLWPIHPERMKRIWRGDDGLLMYRVKNDDGTATDFHQEEMFHVPGKLSEDGVTGRGVIPYANESVGMGLATEQFGASLFGNGAGPAMVMTHPKTLGAEAADSLRRSWAKRYSGPDRANGFLVLEEGTTVTPMTIPPEQAQFLQTRQFNITEIARWYNVPPHLLRELSKSSFSNIESESLHFVLISLMPWLVRWEDECNRQLLIESEKGEYFFKFLLQGLLRGDTAARTAHYKEMRMMGAYSVNDILELEDRNPIGPEGDERITPLNMTTLGAAPSREPTPPREEPEEPDDPDEPDDDEAAITRTTLAAAAQCVLSATLSGLIGYEARQAVRAAAHPRDFESWCGQFYGDKFSTTFSNQVGPLLASAGPLGVTVTQQQFAATHVETSKRELLALLDRPMNDFAAAVQSTVDGWESRALTEAASAFSTTTKG